MCNVKKTIHGLQNILHQREHLFLPRSMSSMKSFHTSFPTTIKRQTLTSLLGKNLGRVLMTSPGWEDAGARREALSGPACAQKQNEEQMQTELSAPQLCCATPPWQSLT